VVAHGFGLFALAQAGWVCPTGRLQDVNLIGVTGTEDSRMNS